MPIAAVIPDLPVDLEDDYTDETGHAHFETADDYEDSRDIKIYVDDEVAEEEIGGGSYTINLP